MDKLVQALKSKTVWLGLATVILPYSDAITGIATGISPVAGAVIGGLIIVLRALTTVPLSEK